MHITAQFKQRMKIETVAEVRSEGSLVPGLSGSFPPIYMVMPASSYTRAIFSMANTKPATR